MDTNTSAVNTNYDIKFNGTGIATGIGVDLTKEMPKEDCKMCDEEMKKYIRMENGKH